MCGIAGIAGFRGSAEALESDADALLAALRHRGPDDEGTRTWSAAGAALVHARLSVIDLTDGGHQPMVCPEQRYWLAFNGEIYNYQALRDELTGQGEHFVSTSDTEVLLRLLARRGPAALSSLRGMYALALWDTRENRLLLARDPLGIKPLYFAQRDGALVFASEVRALLATSLVARAPCADGLFGYLRTGSVPEPYTLVEGVRSLPAGHFVQWRAGNTHTRAHWTFPRAGTADEPQALARDALADCVNAHLVSDVPVGLFLSGGLDSASVLALASAHGAGVPRTFSIGVDHPGLDESVPATRIAQAFGATHQQCRVDFDQAGALLPGFLAALDQPSIDGFNTYCVSRLASAHGMKVVLSGVGGDELFGGYPSFTRVPVMARWRRRLGPLAPWLAQAARFLTPALSPRVRRGADILAAKATLAASYTANRSVFCDSEARRITQALCGREPRAIDLMRADATESHAHARDTVSYLETTRYLRNQLLRDGDVMSMSVGLELRTPLVDHKLLEQLWSLPAHVRLAPGKRLLRTCLPQLPDWIGQAPRRGFTLPFTHWLQRGLLADRPLTSTLTGISTKPWYRQWSLAVLDDWQRRHLGGALQ